MKLSHIRLGTIALCALLAGAVYAQPNVEFTGPPTALTVPAEYSVGQGGSENLGIRFTNTASGDANEVFQLEFNVAGFTEGVFTFQMLAPDAFDGGNLADCVSGPVTVASGQTVSCFIQDTTSSGDPDRLRVTFTGSGTAPLNSFEPLVRVVATADASAPFGNQDFDFNGVVGATESAGSVTFDNVRNADLDVVDVSAVLNVQPANINFPATENGTSSSAQAFTISNDGTDGIDMEVSDVSLATGTHFSISPNTCATPTFTLSDGDSCTYDAVFSPAAIGNFTDTVTVTSNAGQVTNDQVELSGEGTAGPAGDITLSADHMFGELLTDEETAQHTFTATNDTIDGSAVDIDTVSLSGDTMHFTIVNDGCDGTSLASGESCPVTVEFAPTADGNDFTLTLTVSGQDGNGDTRSDTATATGSGVSEARFATDPGPSINLGTTEPGGSLNRNVVISNEGNAELTVSCGALEGDDPGQFSVSATPTSVAAGASADPFTVSCDVPDVGSISATLSCTTNDPDNNPVVYEFSCSARPLVIPTMQPWGLVLLTMLMLMVGGLSIRYFRF